MISRTPIDGYREHVVYARERPVTIYAPPSWDTWRVGRAWNEMVFESDPNCWGDNWKRKQRA